jgi:CBS domain containing-hemolysin-like protein
MEESGPGLTSEEKAMINRVFDLQNLRVQHVMVPLANVVSVPAETTMSEVMRICRERRLTRLPVLHTETKRVAGIINLERVIYLQDLDLNKKAADYLQPALFLNDHLVLEEAFRRMQRGGGRMGIVLDRSHHEVGIISLQDILKVIFGEVTL